jgi:hypothetical protein
MRQIVDTAGTLATAGSRLRCFGDGGCASVIAVFVQGFAQPHDALFELAADGAGVVVGAARARFECCRPLGFLAFDQLLDPVA